MLAISKLKSSRRKLFALYYRINVHFVRNQKKVFLYDHSLYPRVNHKFMVNYKHVKSNNNFLYAHIGINTKI